MSIRTKWRAYTLFQKALMFLALFFVVLFITAPFLPFVFNTTISMPRGLYYTYPCIPERGDLVQFRPPEPYWQLALDRGYVSERTQGLLKKVAAISGDQICWRDETVFINGQFSASFSKKDSLGRPLGHEPTCRTIPDDYFLPLASQTSMSYDGRYFGIVSLSSVKKCLRPLWIDS